MHIHLGYGGHSRRRPSGGGKLLEGWVRKRGYIPLWRFEQLSGRKRRIRTYVKDDRARTYPRREVSKMIRLWAPQHKSTEISPDPWPKLHTDATWNRGLNRTSARRQPKKSPTHHTCFAPKQGEVLGIQPQQMYPQREIHIIMVPPACTPTDGPDHRQQHL